MKNNTCGLVKHSYFPCDVTILLKDITGKIEGKGNEEREKLIQAGLSYSEMLPIEKVPSAEYMRLYNMALEKFSYKTALAVGVLCERLCKEKENNLVLVSLARAGIPVGILMKNYIKAVYGVDVPHYSISIIRGRGIDKNAMNYILSRHKAESLQFVDGWTGKGAILTELRKDLEEFEGVSNELAVLADPANICRLIGTEDDFLIPCSCLNSIVSGLISRTVLNKDLIGENDFHGAVYYEEFKDSDVSQEFIDKISAFWSGDKASSFQEECLEELERAESKVRNKITGLEEVKMLQKEFEVADINLIKPSIGETTRVLLRRVPWKILVKDKNDVVNVGHILKLAEEKGVEVIEYPSLLNYNCVGIIKNSADI